ncbi:MAG: primosomal protein DnaI [Bacilli bacterium]|jgi:primosomal protein DnaI|nr:primosomal protein DnaI [Bacilli bacterium]
MSEIKFDLDSLKESYKEASKDIQFRRLVKTIKASDDIAMKYTSSLEETVKELNNCSKCKGLIYCKNRLEGHVFYPELKDNTIIFSYAPCKYRKEALKAEQNRISRDKDILMASMKDIDKDKERIEVIKWIKKFYDSYDKNSECKGLYLHGNFGCGKTFLISALFNELSKKRISSEIVYFPELLRDIKSDFDSYGDRMEYLEDVDLLLIDDIGAEKVTDWSRDEILGTILQKRMNNYKATFFTSNLDIEGLESHLRINNNSDDEIKAKRIIERIKQLCDVIELQGENKRK